MCHACAADAMRSSFSLPAKSTITAMRLMPGENPMSMESSNLTWLDLEMTGLDPQQDAILEIATVVTDANLNVIAEGPNLAIHQPDAKLAGMDAWNTRQHSESGLVERVRASRLSLADAERITLEFLRQHAAPQSSPLCGNSICQDRRFLWQHMPELERYFHYRQIDVSTLKELMRRWRPELKDGFRKQSRHRALDDIYESIAELRYYRQHFLR
jgi:oligoribonuclease